METNFPSSIDWDSCFEQNTCQQELNQGQEQLLSQTQSLPNKGLVSWCLPESLAKSKFDEETWLLVPSCYKAVCQLQSKWLHSTCWKYQQEGALVNSHRVPVRSQHKPLRGSDTAVLWTHHWDAQSSAFNSRQIQSWATLLEV